MSRPAFAAATLLALAFVLAGIGPKGELSAQDAIVPFEYELIPAPNPYQPPWPAGLRTQSKQTPPAPPTSDTNRFRD